MKKITKAEYVEGYRIRFTFEDGSEHLADFAEFVLTSANPLIRKFADESLFSQFRIEHWGLTVAWGDNEMDIAAEDIYNGVFDVPSRIKDIKFKKNSKNFSKNT